MEYYKKVNAAIEELFGKNIQDPSQDSDSVEPEKTDWNSNFPPHLDESFVRLGDKYISFQNMEYAIECYREALRINPKNTMAFNRLIILPSHLYLPESDPEKKMIQLAVNDAFRQTWVGGYIVLSKMLNSEKRKDVLTIMDSIQNLPSEYFDKHSGPNRDYGVVYLNGKSYVWMINNYEDLDHPTRYEFPVLILMRRTEYQRLKNMLNSEN